MDRFGECAEGFQEVLKCLQSYNKKEVKLMTTAALKKKVERNVPTVLVFKIHARYTKRFWSIGGLVPFTEEQIQGFRQ
jgi:hypothetical protein